MMYHPSISTAKLTLLTLSFIILLMFTSHVSAQVQSATDIFNKKNYMEYITNLTKEFADTPLSKLSYETIARGAIAIDKTNGWDSQSGKQAQELLKDEPDAKRYLDAIHLLLEKDPRGLDKLIQGTVLSPTVLMHVAKMLREHGYDFAANAIGVLSPDLPGKRILYLASIPKDKRPAIEKTLLDYVKDPPNRTMLATTALDMFLRPPAGITIDPKEYYAIALKIGQGTGFVSFDTAQKLSQGGKEEEAVEMVSKLAAENSSDELLQIRAARFLRSMGNQTATNTLYLQALTTVPDPFRREVRLDYLEYLQWQMKEDEISKLQSGKDILLAGDAALVVAQYEDASKQFTNLAQIIGDSHLFLWYNGDYATTCSHYLG